MEHAVHLGAGHFISDISPLSSQAVLAKAKKLKQQLKKANPDLDDDELEALLTGGQEDDGEDDGHDAAVPADAVGKALALVKQIRMSPQAQAFFKKMCEEAGGPVLQLLGWIDKFADMKESIQAGLDNVDKWYRKTDDTDVYFICLTLDPNFKTAYVASAWDSVAYDEGMAKLEAKFDAYFVEPAPLASSSQLPAAQVLAQKTQDLVRIDPREELKAYLNAPLKEIVDTVSWWGYHAGQYPTLACMARDYLAIQNSVTASERAFSNGSLTGTQRRNHLSPKMFEALQILKSAYHNNHIGAAAEATKHMNEYFDALDVEEEDEESEA